MNTPLLAAGAAPAPFPPGRVFEVMAGGRWRRARYATDADTGVTGVYVRFGLGEWRLLGPSEEVEWRDIAAVRQAGISGSNSDSEPAPAAALAEVTVSSGEGPPQPIAYPDLVTRVTRMVRTLRAMRDPEWRFLSAGGRINWPATIDSLEDKRAQAENGSNLDPPPPRFVATARDLAQLDEAHAWFLALDPMSEPLRRKLVLIGKQPLSPSQSLIWMQASGATYRTIAEKTGVTHETARRRTLAAWDRLWAIAKDHLARPAVDRQRARPQARRTERADPFD